MEETALLEGIGLTKGGIKVYFALLELGPSTTGEIIKKAKVSRSKVYEMLERLMDKGLVSFVIKENTKYFEAADPEHILHYVRREKSLLEEKEEELRKILPALKEKRHFGRVPQTATIYEGIKGIKTIYSDVLYTLRKGQEYYAIAAEPEVTQDKEFMAFIMNFHRRREKKGVKAKLLACVKIKDVIFKTVATTKSIQVRYFRQHLPSAILIYGENVATYVWSANPNGVVIRSPAIARRYKRFFEEIWSESEK